MTETATDLREAPNPLRSRRADDYDLHGLVGIRVVDASPSDAAAVGAQLGPIAAPLSREPDIVIRFVDRLPLTAPLRLLGIDDAGYTDEAFVILRSKHKSPARVKIPFQAIGGRCEIVCDRGLAAVPLLIPIINLTALVGGVLPLHAAAFRYRGTGVLVTGWSKGGKTETLLGFAANGAEYIGDEWIYLSDDGQRMFGIPEPIRIWDWHLDELPDYRRRVGRGARARLAILRGVSDGLDRLSGDSSGAAGKRRRNLNRMSHLLKSQRHVDLSPERAFGLTGAPLKGNVDKVIFIASHDSPEIRIEAVAPEEVASRMAFSLQEERSELMAYYRKFRFAFPDECNPLIAAADQTEHERLASVLEGKECYAVYHPYPVSIPSLFEAIRPFVDA